MDFLRIELAAELRRVADLLLTRRRIGIAESGSVTELTRDEMRAMRTALEKIQGIEP
jgi:hypothetical protein